MIPAWGFIAGLVLWCLLLGACRPAPPVMPPERWDPTVYCRTVAPPDPSCKTHH